MKVLFYGIKKQPVVDFIESLPLKDQARILACLKSIEELGFNSPRVIFRQIKNKLWEIKIVSTSGGFRIFCVTLKRDIIYYCMDIKNNRKKPQKKKL